MKTFLIWAVLLSVLGCSAGKYANVKNLHSATGTTLVCFGNSLTAGQGAPAGSDYPSLLAKKLSLPVINAGISGDTAANALSRIERDVLFHDPKVVIVELGANDFLRTGGRRGAVDQAFADLETIIDRIQEHDAVVVLAGISVNYDIEQRYKKLAKKKGAVLAPNIMAGIITENELMADSLHPNAKGYNKMAENFIEVLEPLLRRMD